MAKPELGEKRRCLSCETKFYDLNKDPAICPKCGVVFEVQVQEKIEPVAKPATPKKEKDTTDEVSNADPDTISLEDADEDDGDTVDGEEVPDGIPDADDDEESNSEVDDSFIDDEDDNANMSDLVNVTKDDNEDT